jgi:hypothetical protein
MTDAGGVIAVAIVSAIPATIGALVSALIALRQRETKTAISEVHTLVNSNLTAVKADLALANSRIEGLVEQIGILQGVQKEKQP